MLVIAVTHPVEIRIGGFHSVILPEFIDQERPASKFIQLLWKLGLFYGRILPKDHVP